MITPDATTDRVAVHEAVAENGVDQRNDDDSPTTVKGRSCPLLGWCIPAYPQVGMKRKILMTLLIFIPVIIFIWLFSDLGLGYLTLKWARSCTQNAENLHDELLAVWGVMIFFMYFFDIEYWDKYRGGIFFRNMWLTVTFSILYFFILLSVEMLNGFFSLFLFVIFLPIYVLSIKRIAYPNLKPRDYSASFSEPMFIVSIITIATYAITTNLIFDSSFSDRISYIERGNNAECVPDFNSYTDCEDTCYDNNTTSTEGDCPDICHGIYNDCVHPFVIYCWPYLCAVVLFFLSFVCSFFSTEKIENDDEVVPKTFVQMWVLFFALLWIAVTLKGENQHMKYLEGMGFCLAVAIFLFVALTLSDPQYLRLLRVQIEKKLGAYVDFIWSLTFLIGLPIFLIYLAMSFLNQRIRRMRFLTRQMFCGGESEDTVAESVEATSVLSSSVCSKKSNGWLTEITSNQIRELEKMEISKLSEWAIYWGMAYVVSAFFSAYLNVVLSLVIEFTQSAPLWQMILYVIITGVTMFLNPVLPGAVIYVFAGIMLIPSYENSALASYEKSQFGDSKIGGLVLCCIISLITKLLACAMQQKVIGQYFSRYVKIRQMVNINSDLMRGTKLILSDSKFTLAKVSIL
mmetsp:Transcript_42459/g.99678  ORF Transcript_42459/g.99678 Transcript_42459/m.99678 type:complete len:628 (+) Transcript_42459:243-2126(+)